MDSRPCWVLGALGTLLAVPSCPRCAETLPPPSGGSFQLQKLGILCPNPARAPTQSHGIGSRRAGDGMKGWKRVEHGKAALTASQHPLEELREELRSQGRLSVPTQLLGVGSTPGKGTIPVGSGSPPRTQPGGLGSSTAAPPRPKHQNSRPQIHEESPWGTGGTGNCSSLSHTTFWGVQAALSHTSN